MDLKSDPTKESTYHYDHEAPPFDEHGEPLWEHEKEDFEGVTTDEFLERAKVHVAELILPAFRNVKDCRELNNLLDYKQRTQDMVVFNGDDEEYFEHVLKPMSYAARFDAHMISLDDRDYSSATFFKLNKPSCLPDGYKKGNVVSFYSKSTAGSRIPYDSITEEDIHDPHMISFWFARAQV